MAWVKIDDQAPRNRKMLRAGPAACWLWVCGLAHCQSQLTDGFISLEVLPMIGVVKQVNKLAAQLVEVGLWEAVKGGYQVHDYLCFNDSRAVVEEHRAYLADCRAQAGRRGGQAAAARRRAKDITDQTLDTVATVQQTVQQVATSVADCVIKPHPIPSHPIPLASAKQEHDRARAPARGNTSIIGKNAHLSHALCDDTHSYCVPASVHHKLADLLAPRHAGDRSAAEVALLAWYPSVWAKLVVGFVMGDAFHFWQGRFDDTFASAAPAASKRMFNATTQADIDAQLAILHRHD